MTTACYHTALAATQAGGISLPNDWYEVRNTEGIFQFWARRDQAEAGLAAGVVEPVTEEV
jgi:hypothetical protein